jgi:FkbM family methyltransferase
VHCFEPLDQPFRTLTTWAATQAGRVVCKKVALGDQQGETTMHYHTEHSPSSSILTTTLHGESLLPQMQLQSGVRVPVSTLDKELEGIVDNLAPEILLKLDVQGYEDRVLRGATKLLKNVHACLLEVCLDELYVGQATFKDLVDYLDQHSLGYAGNIRQSYAADGRVMWLDALFTRRR